MRNKQSVALARLALRNLDPWNKSGGGGGGGGGGGKSERKKEKEKKERKQKRLTGNDVSRGKRTGSEISRGGRRSIHRRGAIHRAGLVD